MLERLSLQRLASMGSQLNISHRCHSFQTNYNANISQLYRSMWGTGELAVD